ncbi:hypothetical protein OOU_Y34scaffold01003g27 [Pyricularia oryzae Y34]|uniref:Uncharacterized protein n=1 Tax=Pyricularia oryzae (strain Y34) TaxID=1143189 RepID=A0AA97NN01_PYRO3|nr:hypothetical protein OOU_Y34scaffold01003g27 [Pyricularia oryzae Y34]
MHHTAAILEWKASASSRRAFVIPKEPNWPLANAGSAAEVTSPLLVIGDEHPLVLGLRVLYLTVAAVEIRRSTRLPGPDAQRPPLIFFGAAQEDGPGDSCRQSAAELAARKDTGVLPRTHTHTHTCALSKGPFSLQPTETGKLYCTLQAVVLRPSESAAHESPSMLSGTANQAGPADPHARLGS